MAANGSLMASRETPSPGDGGRRVLVIGSENQLASLQAIEFIVEVSPTDNARGDSG